MAIEVEIQLLATHYFFLIGGKMEQKSNSFLETAIAAISNMIRKYGVLYPMPVSDLLSFFIASFVVC